jgi:hypothetical protein
MMSATRLWAARPFLPSGGFMSIVDELIENLVERNVIDLNGTFTISVVNGGLNVKGIAHTSLKDTKKNNKEIFKADAPIDAQVSVGEIVIPVPEIK